MKAEEFEKRLSKIEELVAQKVKSLEEQLDRQIQQNQDLAGEIQQLQDEIMGYKHRVEMLSGMENLMRDFVNDAVNEKLEQIKPTLFALLKQGHGQGIDLTNVQTDLTLHKVSKPVKFSTDTVRGKILWIAANDLKGKWAVGSEYLEAAQEKGWSLKANSLYPAIAELATKGLLGKKKAEGDYAYRLSEDVKLEEQASQ